MVVQATARRRAAQRRRVAMEADTSLARPLEEEHPAKQNELAKALETMVRHLPTPLVHLSPHCAPAIALHCAESSSLQPVFVVHPHLPQRTYFQIGQDQKKWVVMAEPVIRLTGR